MRTHPALKLAAAVSFAFTLLFSASAAAALKDDLVTVLNAHLRTFNLDGKDRTGYDPYANAFDIEDKLQTEATAMALWYGGVDNLGLSSADLQEIYDFFSYMLDTDGWLYSDYTTTAGREYKKGLHNAWALIAIDILEANGITDTDSIKTTVRDTLEAAIDVNGYMAGDPDGDVSDEYLRTKFVQSLPFLLKIGQDTSDTGAIAAARRSVDFYMSNCIDANYDVWRIDSTGAKQVPINSHEVTEFAHGLALFHQYETDTTRKTTIENNLTAILQRYSGSIWSFTNSYGEKYLSHDGSSGTVNTAAQFQIQYVLAYAAQQSWVDASEAEKYMPIADRIKISGFGDAERDNNYYYNAHPDTGASLSSNINSYCPAYGIHAVDVQSLISGYVLDSGTTPLEGVLVSADNGGGSDTTDGSGYYQLSVPEDWSGAITPTKLDYVFAPTSRSYSNVTADITDEDYTATYPAVCGNNLVESGEDCDDGNTDPGDCCSAICQYEPQGTSCGNPGDGVCDLQDTCDGSGVCDDQVEPVSTVCRADAGECDIAETCDGVGACPADAFEPDTTVCRSDAGACDLPESCTGSSPVCPDDAYEPAGTPCDDGNICTENEECNGLGICTGDAIQPCAVPALNPWGQLLVGLFILASGLGLVSQRKR